MHPVRLVINILFFYVLYKFVYRTSYCVLDHRNSRDHKHNKSYKSALCLSGQIRNATSNYNYIKTNVIDHLHPDIFCCMDGNVTDQEKQEFLELYKPTSIVWHTKEFPNTKLIKNTEKMFYRIHRCNELKKVHETTTNQTYDIVIRSRPDLIFNYAIPYSIIERIIQNPKTIYIPEWYAGNLVDSNYSVYDWFAVGDSEAMDSYADIYPEIKTNTNTICDAPEYIMKQYFDAKQIKYDSFYYEIGLNKTFLQILCLPYDKAVNDKYYKCVLSLSQ